MNVSQVHKLNFPLVHIQLAGERLALDRRVSESKKKKKKVVQIS